MVLVYGQFRDTLFSFIITVGKTVPKPFMIILLVLLLSFENTTLNCRYPITSIIVVV